MTLSFWQGRHLTASSESASDVLILGGGYVGLSTAFWLSEYRPDLNITLLERSTCGAGASGRNAGFLTVGSCSFYKSLSLKWGHHKALEIQKFAEASLELAHEQLSSHAEFERVSSLTLFQNQDNHASWMTDGFLPADFKFSWKDREDLPQKLQGRFFGSLEFSHEYKVNPLNLLESLKARLQSRRIKIIENVSGFAILPDGVHTESQRFRTKQVVLALNGYLPQFSEAFGHLITARRAQMMAVELEEDIHCPSLHYDPIERVYWRGGPGKTLLIGGKRLLDEEGEKGEFDKVSSIIQTGLERYLNDQLNVKYKVINRWSGTMGFTENELPLIAKIQAPIDTIVIGGFSGHGMGLGFKSAQEGVKLLLGEIPYSFFDQFKKISITL